MVSRVNGWDWQPLLSQPLLCLLTFPLRWLPAGWVPREAIRRGMASTGEVVLLIDGTSGLENMGRQNFKDCVQIVDSYHALEHAGLVLAALIGKDHPDYKARHHRWAKRLLKDKVQALIEQTRRECASKPRAQAVEKELGYFVRNIKRMPDGTFRA